MKRILALFTALLLLTGCSSLAQPLPADTPLPPETDSSADPDPASAPEDDADVSDPAPDAESAALWQSYLEHVDGDLLSVQWLIYDNDARPTGVEVGGLLLAAAADAIGHDAVFDPIWTLLIYLNDGNDGVLLLSAGLEEGVVEVHGLEPLTDGRVFLRNDALYQLVRTNMDNPEDANPQETHIDEAVYQQYQRNIQGYLEDADQQFSYPDVAYQRKLTDVSLYAESDFLQVKIYCIGTVVTTEPPEAAASLIAGGGFVDSALQLHEDGNGSDNFMVCADGHCVGFVGWEFAEQLDAFQTQEELVAAVESQGRMFPPEA